MAELTEAAIADIVEHMNADHGDSIRDYARYYGDMEVVDTATLRTFDEDSMTIGAIAEGKEHVLIVDFDRSLEDTDDARDTLIKMAQTSAKRLASGQ
jgi:putative heme iron utilization protein